MAWAPPRRATVRAKGVISFKILRIASSSAVPSHCRRQREGQYASARCAAPNQLQASACMLFAVVLPHIRGARPAGCRPGKIDRTSVVYGKSRTVRVDLGGRRQFTKKNNII